MSPCRKLSLAGFALLLCCRFSFAAIGADLPANPSLPATNPPAFKTIREVHLLSPVEAARQLPVRIRGVVTFHNQNRNCFVQDETDGVYVRRPLSSPPLKPGQLVEIVGVTGAGDFAPRVFEHEATILGEGPLPSPQTVTFAELASGAEDCRFVEVSGVVRIAKPAGQNHLNLVLAFGGGRLRADVYDVPTDPRRLIDSLVRLRGAVGSTFNQNRQLLAPLLFVSGAANVEILQAASEEPFDVPSRPVRSLLQFSPKDPVGHRVKVAGVVTHFAPGEFLFIRDGEQGLHVKTEETTPLQPGDLVEILGFPVMGRFSPLLEDATFRRLRSEPVPHPIKTGPSAILDGKHDSDLVTLSAQLLDVALRGSEYVLVSQSSNLVFNAHLSQSPEHQRTVLALQKGSELELTGICLVEEVRQTPKPSTFLPSSFRLVLRSPADIVTIKRPSWWTPQRLSVVLGVMSLLIAAALIWIRLLNRKVRKQTEIIRKAVERKAILEERNRIAREFHDTLEQELAGLSIQLDAAASRTSDAVGHELLALSRNLIEEIQANARYAIMDLRARALQDRDLAAALSETASRFMQSHPVTITVSVSGSPCRLEGRLDHNLLRIGQEAIANAIKHARCQKISVELLFEAAQFTLLIVDNGCGLTTHPSRSENTGHYGLMGMRERAKKMGGEFSIRRCADGGTQITVTIPISRAQRSLPEILDLNAP